MQLHHDPTHCNSCGWWGWWGWVEEREREGGVGRVWCSGMLVMIYTHDVRNCSNKHDQQHDTLPYTLPYTLTHIIILTPIHPHTLPYTPTPLHTLHQSWMAVSSAPHTQSSVTDQQTCQCTHHVPVRVCVRVCIEQCMGMWVFMWVCGTCMYTSNIPNKHTHTHTHNPHTIHTQSRTQPRGLPSSLLHHITSLLHYITITSHN